MITKPELGMGVTINYYTDKRPGTIISISGKRVTVQLDKAVRADTNGMSEVQEYTYSEDPNGNTVEFSLRKNGRYRQVGEGLNSGAYLTLGTRRMYFDFSF